MTTHPGHPRLESLHAHFDKFFFEATCKGHSKSDIQCRVKRVTVTTVEKPFVSTGYLPESYLVRGKDHGNFSLT